MSEIKERVPNVDIYHGATIELKLVTLDEDLLVLPQVRCDSKTQIDVDEEQNWIRIWTLDKFPHDRADLNYNSGRRSNNKGKHLF